MRRTRLMVIAVVVLGASVVGAVPAAASAQPTMPSVVGENLWSALDKLPPLDDISTVDATGGHRIALLPTIWKVCTQTPAPGTELTPDTPITLGVVKSGETCP